MTMLIVVNKAERFDLDHNNNELKNFVMTATRSRIA